jgi:hypothetical protein
MFKAAMALPARPGLPVPQAVWALLVQRDRQVNPVDSLPLMVATVATVLRVARAVPAARAAWVV